MDTLTRAAEDIDLQRTYDRRRSMGYGLLEVRFRACLDASMARARGSEHARHAERQALVDLASCAQEMAARMLAPTLVMRG